LIFKRLSQKNKKHLLEHAKWRFLSWKDIAMSAGLNETHAKSFYNYLCGYAHAGSINILQIQQAHSADNQKALFSASIGLLMIAMANMIRFYCNLFPKSNEAQEASEHKEIVDKWIWVGQHSAKDIEIDWSKIDL